MRTNIDIDDQTLEAAMRAGPYKTKKEAVEAGLKLLARQAAYREVLKWEGKLKWDGEPWSDREQPAARSEAAAALHIGDGAPAAHSVQEPQAMKRGHGRR